MKNKNIALVLFFLVLLSGLTIYIYQSNDVDDSNRSTSITIPIQTRRIDANPKTTMTSDSLSISEPLSYKNLQIFMLYRNEDIKGSRYVTLDDALNAKLIVVKETSDVNELKVDNTSNSYIYINSGDIVRGGKQDRTIQYDVILSPKMRNVNLASFCVEHDRWQNRGSENVHQFSSSKNTLSSKELKVATKLSRDQYEVWDKVETYQNKANSNIAYDYSDYGAVDVKKNASGSSLELTLENDVIKKIKADYKSFFIKQIQMKGAVGIACYINGELASIDLYNNHTLFEDLFEKLLDAAIAESISEKTKKQNALVQVVDVQNFIGSQVKTINKENVNKMTQFIVSKQGKKLLLFTCIDREENKWLHKNWLEK